MVKSIICFYHAEQRNWLGCQFDSCIWIPWTDYACWMHTNSLTHVKDLNAFGVNACYLFFNLFRLVTKFGKQGAGLYRICIQDLDCTLDNAQKLIMSRSSQKPVPEDRLLLWDQGSGTVCQMTLQLLHLCQCFDENWKRTCFGSHIWILFCRLSLLAVSPWWTLNLFT